jgi:adenosine deaminase
MPDSIVSGAGWLDDAMSVPSSTEPTAPTREQVLRAPKVLLHDHLDGGLRPQTILELAAELGHELPADDAASLGDWFAAAADSGSLVRYLETFDHTVAVMQTGPSLTRVARECVEDLAADGVVYAEVRYAPEQHVEQGLTLDEVVHSVVRGFEIGSAGRNIRMGALCTAMRTQARSLEIAELAVRHRDEGVVGFDIAGAEKGYPPTQHLDAFQYVQRANFHTTIHAGEAFGLPSIWEAIQWCGAERLGHGVRVRDDIKIEPNGSVTLGGLAAFIRDRRIPLELCPSSNVHTGVAPTIAEHPIKVLRDLRFRVTLNTDNRLMSDCSMSSEMQALVDAFGWNLADLQWLTINAMKSSFIHFDERLRLIDGVIKPAYAVLEAEAI